MANITKAELQEYCMMFPIAYYAGKPLPLEAADISTSCANVVNNSIMISLSQVNDMLKSSDYVNPAIIRPIVYHEVSHVILTPKNIGRGSTHVCYNNKKYELMRMNEKMNDERIEVFKIINIFEDERIECLTRDTYMDVNFYANLCRINKWQKPRVPLSISMAFYDMIRHHAFVAKGFKWHEFYNRSRTLIVKWSALQPDSDDETVFAYSDDIFDLYYDFVEAAVNSEEFMASIAKAKEEDIIEKQKAAEQAFQEREKERREREKALQEKASQETNEHEEPEGNPESNEEGQDGKPEKDSTAETENAQQDVAYDLQTPDPYQERFDKEDEPEHDETAGKDESDHGKTIGEDESSEELDGDPDDTPMMTTSGMPSLNVEQARKSFNQFIFDMQDQDVKKLLMQKFFIKDMHGQQMGAMHKHSGKLDVKAVGRKDWKIFKQPSMFSDGSKIGKKMHLILVLDQSGSYASNDYATNLILASLKSAEEHIKAFEFTVLKFGNGFHVCKKDERYSDSHEGTLFSVKLFQQIDKLKRQDSANFIIFLNDGAAWSSCWYEDKRMITAAMKKALDHDNCVCILDYDAHDSWFKSIKTAKVIVTYDYVQQLSKNVCEALSAMLAV